MTGGSQHEVFNYGEYLRDHINGAFSIRGGVNDVVKRMTGKPAESFATIAARCASQPFAQPTPSNLLKAVARFSVLPFFPGYNLSTYQRACSFRCQQSHRCPHKMRSGCPITAFLQERRAQSTLPCARTRREGYAKKRLEVIR